MSRPIPLRLNVSHTDKYKDTRSLTHAYTRNQSQYPIQAFVWEDKRAERERQRERERVTHTHTRLRERERGGALAHTHTHKHTHTHTH